MFQQRIWTTSRTLDDEPGPGGPVDRRTGGPAAIMETKEGTDALFGPVFWPGVD